MTTLADPEYVTETDVFDAEREQAHALDVCAECSYVQEKMYMDGDLCWSCSYQIATGRYR